MKNNNIKILTGGKFTEPVNQQPKVEEETKSDQNFQYDLYMSHMSDIFDFLGDYKEDVSYFINPEMIELGTLSFNDPEMIFEYYDRDVPLKDIEVDQKRIDSFRSNLKIRDDFYVHVYERNKKSKQVNDAIKKKIKPIMDNIIKFRDIIEFNGRDDSNVHVHVFETEHKNVFRCLFCGGLLDEEADSMKNFIIPATNFIKHTNKAVQSCNMHLIAFENDDNEIKGYGEYCLHIYNFMFSFALDINDKCKFKPENKQNNKERNFGPFVVKMQDPGEAQEALKNVSTFLPMENKSVLMAAFYNTKHVNPVFSTGKKVIDFEFNEIIDTGDDIVGAVTCIYDNNDNKKVYLEVGSCTFTNVWMQMLRLTDYKCDDPDLYNKLLVWYTGDE